jgi:tripartite-type tricarboxylate transporter receptor subunit TctC
VRQFLESGDLIPIVVFAEKRLPDFPDVPTAAESGIELWGLDNFRTLAVRADTPPDGIAKLSQVLNAALDTEVWKAFCAQTYSCVEEKLSPEQATAAVRDFYDKIVEFQKQFAQ